MPGEIAGQRAQCSTGVCVSQRLRAGYQGRVSGYQAIWQGMRAYRAAAPSQAEAAPSQEEGQSDHVICQSPLFPARKSGGRRGRCWVAGVWAPERGCAGATPERETQGGDGALTLFADVLGKFVLLTGMASTERTRACDSS